jgi:hypothetical protein
LYELDITFELRLGVVGVVFCLATLNVTSSLQVVDMVPLWKCINELFDSAPLSWKGSLRKASFQKAFLLNFVLGKHF